MARPSPVTLLAGLLAASPALAHPGHGLPGWLHHGELPVLATIAAGAIVVLLVRGLAAARAGRPGDDR